MKLIVIVKGNKLGVTEHFCDRVSVSGDIDMVFFINQSFERIIRPINANRTITLLGKGLELITHSRDMVVLDGDIDTYLIRDGEYIPIVHPLTEKDFK